MQEEEAQCHGGHATVGTPRGSMHRIHPAEITRDVQLLPTVQPTLPHSCRAPPGAHKAQLGLCTRGRTAGVLQREVQWEQSSWSAWGPLILAHGLGRRGLVDTSKPCGHPVEQEVAL